MVTYNDNFQLSIMLKDARRLAKKFIYYVWKEKVTFLEVHYVGDDPFDCFEWKGYFISGQDCWIALNNNLKPKAIQAWLEYMQMAQGEAKYGIKAFCDLFVHYDAKSFCMEYHPDILTDEERNT